MSAGWAGEEEAWQIDQLRSSKVLRSQSPDLAPEPGARYGIHDPSHGFSFQINALQTQAEPVSSFPGRPPIIDQSTPDPKSG